jgi:DNA (cytosine-5)-methyltransferase 1
MRTVDFKRKCTSRASDPSTLSLKASFTRTFFCRVSSKFRFLDFFAGAGLVTEAVSPHFDVVWANDISPKKAEIYLDNHGHDHFRLGSVEAVSGSELPTADLAWASFPCQDLSLAGNQAGIQGKRSGMVWEWLRVIEEMPEPPPVLVAENVLGLLSAANGMYYQALHLDLVARGYTVGAVVLDAVDFLPHSRARVFVVAVRSDLNVSNLIAPLPGWCHPDSIVRAAQGMPNWVYWKIAPPAPRKNTLEDILDWDAPTHDEPRSKKTLSLIAPQHQTRLLQELTNGFRAAPGYRRTRNGKQVLELRFDGIAGCLRTPEGGSSRQFIVLKRDGKLATRLITAREAARLMGLPERYRLPKNYNDAYKAMGDAVAVPAVRHLAKVLLKPLCQLSQSQALSTIS